MKLPNVRKKKKKWNCSLQLEPKRPILLPWLKSIETGSMDLFNSYLLSVQYKNTGNWVFKVLYRLCYFVMQWKGKTELGVLFPLFHIPECLPLWSCRNLENLFSLRKMSWSTSSQGKAIIRYFLLELSLQNLQGFLLGKEILFLLFLYGLYLFVCLFKTRLASNAHIS